MKLKLKLIGSFLLIAFSLYSQEVSDFKVHSLFQNNMVIQRDKPINVWGWSKAGDKVSVDFANKTMSATTAKDGKWLVTFPKMEANTKPTNMKITSKYGKVTIENILVGDVWILGGQSNMEWPISRVDNGVNEVVSANYPAIRLMTIPKIFSAELKTNFPSAAELSAKGQKTSLGSWLVCTPQTVVGMSAIGYAMARRIHMTTGVPVAIINTARGGTTVEGWTPLAKMAKLESKEVKERLENNKGKPHHIPGNCFASIISPLGGFAVKGTIFHQGYNNCFSGVQGAVMYRAIFPELIKGWRETFNDPAMPFLILGQCTAGKKQSRENHLSHLGDIGARIREAQYQTYLQLYKAGDKKLGYGAGVASSIGEIEHLISEQARFRKFMPHIDCDESYPIQKVQDLYRVTEDFDEALRDL